MPSPAPLVKYYVLENLRPVQVTFSDWADWSQETNGEGYIVNQNTLFFGTKEYRLMTVFRGIGNNLYTTEMWPKLEGKRDIEAYKTMLDAKHGHLRWVDELVKRGYRLLDNS